MRGSSHNDHPAGLQFPVAFEYQLVASRLKSGDIHAGAVLHAGGVNREGSHFRSHDRYQAESAALGCKGREIHPQPA